MANPTKISSSQFKVLLVDGYSLISAKMQSFAWKIANGTNKGKYTGLGDEWQESSATGMRTATVTLGQAFFDTATNAIHDAFSALTDVVRILCFAPAGNIAGRIFVGIQGAYNETYEAAPQVGDLAKANAALAASGQVDQGMVVQPWVAHTADWTTGTELSLAIVRSSTTATATTTPAHGYAVGTQVIVTIAGAVETEYNGRVTATITGASTFTYTVSGSPSSPATGTITGGVTTDYTLDPFNLSIPITSNTAASPSVVTCPVPHNLTTGDKVLISGVSLSNATINGVQTVTKISATTFSVAVDASTHAGTGGKFVRVNSNNGGVGYQSVSALSGFTGFIGKIEHSDDDATYTTLITFTNVTSAPAAERKTVSGTVKRYVRFNGDVTGSGSITPFVGFKRNAPQ